MTLTQFGGLAAALFLVFATAFRFGPIGLFWGWKMSERARWVIVLGTLGALVLLGRWANDWLELRAGFWLIVAYVVAAWLIAHNMHLEPPQWRAWKLSLSRPTWL